jgi:hypothetical protein
LHRLRCDDILGTVSVHLTADDLAQIDAILPAGAAAGARLDAQSAQRIDRLSQNETSDSHSFNIGGVTPGRSRTPARIA